MTHAMHRLAYKIEISCSRVFSAFFLVDFQPYLLFGLQLDIFFFNLQLRKHDDDVPRNGEEEEEEGEEGKGRRRRKLLIV